MSVDVKRAVALGGGGLVAVAVLGGGWMWWSEGQRRDALGADLQVWSTAVAGYGRCMVGDAPLSAGELLLSQAGERGRDGRCYAEHLAGLSWSEDEAIAPLRTAVAALAHGEPASPRLSELDADQTCKQVAAVDAALASLRASIGAPAAPAVAAGCALALEPLPLVQQPPASPDVPGIRRGALRQVEQHGDRVFAGYRMSRQGVLAWKEGAGDWKIVPTEDELEGVYWGSDKPWGIIPDPEAPPGMIRYRVTAWSGAEWLLRSALPEGLLPVDAAGPDGSYAVISGPTWLAAVRSLREQSISLLPMPDEGRAIGEPVVLMALPSGRTPALQFSADGALLGMVLSEDPGGWAFSASHIAPGAAEVSSSRIFLPVDVPDPLQSDTIATCGDGAVRYALAADRWVLRGTGGGTDWRLHHTFKAPMRRAVMACHGDSLAILGDLDGAREAVELHHSTCTATGCTEPAALGEQQFDGRAVVWDDDGLRFLGLMLGHAVVFHASGEALTPEAIFSAGERPEDALPIATIDGRLFSIRTE
jgi:hypothetical protein